MSTYQPYERHYEQWRDVIEGMIAQVLIINQLNGWFDKERSFGDDVALLHSEVSEMYEAYRIGNDSGKKDSIQDEAADILIRLLDTCYRNNIDLYKQFAAKCELNTERGYRHGNKVV